MRAIHYQNWKPWKAPVGLLEGVLTHGRLTHTESQLRGSRVSASQSETRGVDFLSLVLGLFLAEVAGNSSMEKTVTTSSARHSPRPGLVQSLVLACETPNPCWHWMLGRMETRRGSILSWWVRPTIQS
ncbi:hypothetical protein FALCPG4_006710 [Fusarium falciforme]